MNIGLTSNENINIGKEAINSTGVPEVKNPTYTIEIAYENSITTVIIIITIILIGSFMIWLIILIIADTPPATLAPCLPDQCATNIFSGVKNCPPPGESLEYNTDIEVCNSRFFCDNAFTPLAEQLDGSTNTLGVCPANVECRCLISAENIIPSYVVTTFRGINGNPYTALASQRLTFVQTLVPPLTQIPNITSEFFSVPSTWLAISSSGCSNLPIPIDFTGETGIQQRKALKACFNDINPCLQGALSFIPNVEAQSINSRELNNMTYSCVRAQTCLNSFAQDNNEGGRDHILIRDFLSGEFLCYNVDDIE